MEAKQRTQGRVFETLAGHYETNNEPSMTVQGEAQSIQEIMAKYAQGLELPRRNAQYLDADFDNPDAFRSPDVDLVDLQHHQERMAEYKYLVDEFERSKDKEPKE